MKSIFTILLFFTVSSFSFAQLTLSTMDTIITTDDAIDESGLDYGAVLLTNTTSDSIEIAVTLERECFAEGDQTAIAVCMGDLCFFPTSTTKTWGDDLNSDPIYKLAPGVPDDALKFTPSEADTFTSTWNVIFFDRHNPDTNVALHVTVGDGVCFNTSVTEFVHEIGKAFPNPAIDRITIPYTHDANDAQLIVFNALGIRMDAVQIDQYAGQVDLDVSQYTDGIYFYYLVDEKGGQSRMLSFVK